MKTFYTIKHDNVYLDCDDYFSTTDINNFTQFYDSYESAETRIKLERLDNCQVVPFAIIKQEELNELKNYIRSYNDEESSRPQICNEYIDATCKDILEKMKELGL